MKIGKKKAKEKKDKVRFTAKSSPIEGVISVSLLLVSIILLIIMVGASAINKGNADLWIGALGLFTFALNVTGFILAVQCFKKEDIYYKLPTIGSLLNGILAIGFMILYFWGALY